MSSHDEKVAALSKAEINGGTSTLSKNELHALRELAKEHSPEGFRAQRLTGNSSAGTWGALS